MLEDLLDSSFKLPSPPVVALKILDSVREADNNFEKIADIIQADPALTAQTLKIANSSLYGLSSQINSLSQAVSLIGTQTLKNIALSFVIIDSFQEAPQGSFNLELFWKRAITAAVAAETLASHLDVNNKDIFVSSLLQDIGLLIMFLSDSKQYTALLDNKRIKPKPIHEMEKDYFGVEHAEISYRLLKAWNFPDSICQTIRNHHNANSFDNRPTHILYLADKISSIYHGMQVNIKSLELYAILNEDYGLPEDKVEKIIDEAGEKSIEIMSLFSIQPGDMKPFSQLMQEAKDELEKLNYSYEQIVLELTQAKRKAEQLATELKQANDSLRELSFRDGLTNLYNHRYFQDFFESEVKKTVKYGQHLALLLLDIDHFKTINDSYGHPAGDNVLIEVGKVLVKLARRCDIVARYGGEEFAIILPETGLSSAKVLAQRLRRGIEQISIEHESRQINITVSIGLISTEQTAFPINRNSLLNGCDQALYNAKNNGRNCIEVFQ